MKLFNNKEDQEEETKDVWVNVKVNFDETLRFTDQIECWFKDKIIDSYDEKCMDIPSDETIDVLAQEKIRHIDKETIKEFFEEFFYDKITMIKDLITFEYIEEDDLEIEIELESDQSEDDEDEEYDEYCDEEDCGEDEEDLNVIASFQMEEDCDRSASSLENITSKIKVQ